MPLVADLGFCVARRDGLYEDGFPLVVLAGWRETTNDSIFAPQQSDQQGIVTLPDGRMFWWVYTTA